MKKIALILLGVSAAIAVLLAWIIIAASLASAAGIEVTEVKKPVMCEINKKPISCAYLMALYNQVRSRPQYCAPHCPTRL